MIVQKNILLFVSGVAVGGLSTALIWKYLTNDDGNALLKAVDQFECWPNQDDSFEPKIIEVVSDRKDYETVLRNIISQVNMVKVIGLDCEWTSTKSKTNPIALLQLTTPDYSTYLLRLNKLSGFLPKELLGLLQDKAVLKVGVGILDDASKLMKDYGIVVQGCLDLRAFAARYQLTRAKGLKSLTKDLLGKDLDKSIFLRCSNWDAETLTREQIQYAALDSLSSLKIFEVLFQRKLTNNPPCKDDITKAVQTIIWNTVKSSVQGLVDVAYKENKSFQSTRCSDIESRDKTRKSKGLPRTPQTFKAMKPHSTRQQPLYDNCRLLAPDDQLLSTCDKKKAQWYLGKGLAERVCEEPFTIRLFFEPSGRPDDDRDYYLYEKENKCVVCGSGESYVRKNVVPHEYRRHFAVAMKDHTSHDILLLCLACHQRSNYNDCLLKKDLEEEYNAPQGSVRAARLYEDPDRRSVRSAGRALLLHGDDRIPKKRKAELQAVVKDYFGADEITEDLIRKAAGLETRVENETYVPHGEKVVTSIYKRLGTKILTYGVVNIYKNVKAPLGESVADYLALMENYTKITLVGAGAFGRNNDKKMLILKEIPMDTMSTEERASAQNEVHVLKVLKHPNIIKYYENFLDGTKLVIAMEYAQGGTLYQYLKKQPDNLSEEEVLHLFVQILIALKYIHSEKILHRDLKTENILLDRKSRVCKVSDFGISKVLHSKTKALTVVGTPCYISPELCEGKPYDQKSDMWAMGCILYELVTLRRAFEETNLPALVSKITKAHYNTNFPKHYGVPLTGLLKKLLSKKPGNRPSVVEIMAEPFIMKKLFEVYCDLGAVEVKNQKTSKFDKQKGFPHASSNTSINSMAASKSQEQFAVYCWGGGISTPMRLPLPYADTQILQVECGRTKKSCVTENGRLIMWESSPTQSLPGAMGDSQNIPAFSPRFQEGQSGGMKMVSCGDMHTACLTDRGILMTFGTGSGGCLGHGDFSDLTEPQIVEHLLSHEVVAISCGSYHVMALTSDGEIYSWGRGDGGRLGLGDKATYSTPKRVPIPLHCEAVSVTCGNDSSVVLTADKKMLCAGSNHHNKLGLDLVTGRGVEEEVQQALSFTAARTAPFSSEEISKVSLGTQHTAVITADGSLYMIGNNQFGQLASPPVPGGRNSTRIPKKVNASPQQKFTDVSCGGTFTVAITESGRVLTWGKTIRGQLGRSAAGSISAEPEAIRFPGFTDMKIVSLSTSHGSSLLAVSGIEKSEHDLETKFRNSWDTNTWREEGKKPQ